MLQRYQARHLGSGRWGVWDGVERSWILQGLGEREARRRAAEQSTVQGIGGQRSAQDIRPLRPPVPVDRAAGWRSAGRLECWVRDEEHRWWGRVLTPDGEVAWILAADLRRGTPSPGQSSDS
jgi:hypothetical protein